MRALPRIALAFALSFGVASAQLPAPPPLCTIVQRFLDGRPPQVLIDLSCAGNRQEQQNLLRAGLLIKTDGSAPCTPPFPSAYRLSAKGAAVLDPRMNGDQLWLTVGWYEALSEQQCGNFVQYTYRLMRNQNGDVLLNIAPGKLWPINASLPHNVTLADSAKPLTEVLLLHYVRGKGWTPDFPWTLGWPGTFPTCPRPSPV